MSNAPRPKESVANFLKNLDFNNKYNEYIFTSGDAALEALNSNCYGKSFFHLGPEKDFDLFLKFIEKKEEDIEKAKFILCTGLFSDKDEDLNFYENFLKDHIQKKMICTNPDLIVHRGNKEEYCAGSVAKVFEKIGGKVVYYGKPYPEIYKACIRNDKKVLVIGDNLNTDIRGANKMNYDSLFIVNGIHKGEFEDKDPDSLKKILKKYNVSINFYQKKLIW
jgi:HAD superfamily hydrolase (TIGR01459 family)